MPETGWQHSRGIDGRNPLDWVATFPWITWQHSGGLGGRNPWNTHSVRREGIDAFAHPGEALVPHHPNKRVAQVLGRVEGLFNFLSSQSCRMQPEEVQDAVGHRLWALSV